MKSISLRNLNIRSLVASAKPFECMRRNGYGTKGNKVRLLTNHVQYRVKPGTGPVFQYDVQVANPTRYRIRGTDLTTREVCADNLTKNRTCIE